MQQAGIEAAAAVGYSDEMHFTLNRSWIPRITTIDYLQPVRYGENLEVKTWVDGVRRVQSRRRYEFRKEGNDDLIANAFTDWVFVDLETGSPVTIPVEVMSAFYPEGVPKNPMRRMQFPEAPPAPPGVFKVDRRVEWGYTDPMRHLNNAAYLNYAEDCAVQLTASFGWPMSRWMEEGIAIVARKNTIEYLKPAFLDDELTIKTWLFDIKPASLIRHYEFSRSENSDLIAKLQTRWAMIDLDTQRPKRIPDYFHDAFASNIASTKP
jgi:acyl-CoA thioester hydrolase